MAGRCGRPAALLCCALGAGNVELAEAGRYLHGGHAAAASRASEPAALEPESADSDEEWAQVEVTQGFPASKRDRSHWPVEAARSVGGAPAHSAIVTEHEARKWWGFPSYADDLDLGPKSWEELARIHGRLGRVCTAREAKRQCGSSYVCREGVCGECGISRDCGEHFRCQVSATSGRRLCVPRILSKQWDWRDVCCTVLIVITAMLSAAAGMGGGGVYVPLLLLLLGLSTQEAVPLSQAMIVGGAIVNVIMFCGERHPKYPHKPKIDYDVVMMLNPGLAAGVTVGVMLNVISPQWLIVLVLLVTLVLALDKSLRKGLKEWEKESKAAAARAQAAASAGTQLAKPSGGGAAAGIKLADLGSFAKLAQSNGRQLGLIVGCWAIFLLANLIKAPQCSMMYWLQQAGMLVVCGAFTVAGAYSLPSSSSDGSAEGMLAWTPQSIRLYPLLSTIAGFLGGFLGIGGGIIMGPLLLELGMLPEASQATTAAFVFLSSSLATIQFIVLGKAMPEYALWFTTWVVIFTFLGQTAVDYVLRRWQRASLIVLSIAAIIAGSLVMMTIIGVSDTVTDLSRGAYMGFIPHHLCE